MGSGQWAEQNGVWGYRQESETGEQRPKTKDQRPRTKDKDQTRLEIETRDGYY